MPCFSRNFYEPLVLPTVGSGEVSAHVLFLASLPTLAVGGIRITWFLLSFKLLGVLSLLRTLAPPRTEQGGSVDLYPAKTHSESSS